MLTNDQVTASVAIAVCIIGLMFTELWYWLSNRLDKINEQLEKRVK